VRGLDTVDRLVNDAGQEDVGSYTTSKQTTDLGLTFVDKHLANAKDKERPFFLWLHYFDVHEHLEVEDSDAGLQAVTKGRKLRGLDKYKAMVGVVDGELGRLRAELDKRGLWDNTIVVLAADHGEGLSEDPRLGETHGSYVYNLLTHVPMAFRIPGVRAGVTDDAVSIADVAPTIASLTSSSWPLGREGMDLLPYVLDGPRMPGTRAIIMTETRQWGVVAWPWKLLVRPEDNLVELYDLSSDMDEKTDLTAGERDRVHQLKQLYRSIPAPAIDRSPEGRQRREEAARAQLRH
jgi:arylsulfatase A-like enzyme